MGAQGYVPVTGIPGGIPVPWRLAAVTAPEATLLPWSPRPEPEDVGYNLYAATDGDSFFPVIELG